MLGLIRHLTLPGTLAHEVGHVIGGAAWCERVAIEIEVRSGAAKARLDWRESPPDVAFAVASIAPALAGLVTGAVALIQWVEMGAPTPSTTLGWCVWTILAMWWSAFVGNPYDAMLGAKVLLGKEAPATGSDNSDP